MTTGPTGQRNGLPQGTHRTLAAARIATAAGEPVRATSTAEIDAAHAARERRTSERRIGVWLSFIAAMLIVMIVLGALTRLTESGLSMVEWRPITGWLPPLTEPAWQDELARYAQSPQGRIVNPHMSVAAFKEIYWLEYIHRLWGRLIGVAFAVPLLWFWVRRQIPGDLRLRLAGLLLLGCMQGVLGWLMVASGLVDQPAVSHFRLAAHLLLAIAILAWIAWLVLGLLWPRTEPDWRHQHGNNVLRHIASWLIVLLFVQITFGAFVAGLRAGQIHTTFPTMSGYWILPELRQSPQLLFDLVANPAGVQLVHRWLGKLMVLGVLLMWWRSRRPDVSSEVRQAAWLALAMVAVQFGLGVWTLLSGAEIWLGVLHQTGAVLLLLAMLRVLRIATPRTESAATTYHLRTA